MRLHFYHFLFFIQIINYIQNKFTIDFSFLLPENSNQITTIINENTNENIYNKSIYKNITYFFNISPMVKLCIGDPFQCFYIQLSFNSYETIININNTNFKYKDSSSFQFLSNTNEAFIASDTIRIGTENKNLIENFNFLVIDNTDGNIISEIGLGKLSKYYTKLPDKELSLIDQLNIKKMIETKEITIKYYDDFSGEIILGTNYTGLNIGESQYLELLDTDKSLNRYLQSIYIEDATTKKQQKDLLAQEKRKRLKIDFNSTFIRMPIEIFEQIKTISFMSYINAEICMMKKDENYDIEYLICKDDILNSNLDRLFIVFDWKKNISVSLNDLFLPYKSEKEIHNYIFGIISSMNNDTINIGSVLLKKYMICLNKDKNSIRLYLKNIQMDLEKTDIFGIAGIITLTIIIFTLIIYMVSTICGKDKYEPAYSPHVQKFLSKKISLDSSMSSVQSNESF